MKEFVGKVAVVTGGASGIGFALCERAVEEGMKVVLADVEKGPLAEAERRLKSNGAEALAVRTDVSSLDDVTALANKTIKKFGSLDLVFNNAGVATYLTTPIWEHTVDTWEWLIGVNLWGVVNGLKTFVPIMLSQGTECHIVNTSSSVGFVSGPGVGIYKATKHAVASISETLFHELGACDAKVKVSVLAPEMVATGLRQARRNMPTHLDEGIKEKSKTELAFEERAKDMARMQPREIADEVFSAIREERFYILPGSGSVAKGAAQRLEDIKSGRPVLLPSLGSER